MSNCIQTGIPGLDTVLCGGFMRHNSILLKGAPGTGKTLLGTQALLHGIEKGEPAVICSFEQFPQQLYRDMRAFGWDLEELVEQEKLSVYFLKPEDLIAPSGAAQTPLLSRIFSTAEERGVRRMLIDSITHFNRVNTNPVECRSVLLQFINAVKCIGITPIMTAELETNGGPRDYSFEEYLVDEVVFLHNGMGGSTASLPQRAIEVTKTRGHQHVRGRHPFQITPAGLEVYPHILPKSFATEEQADAVLETVGCGVTGVDRLIGGGFVRGTSTIVAGMAGAYKTTLASTFLAEGARKGEKGLLITFEEMPQQLIKMQSQRGIDLTEGVKSGHLKIAHYVPKECWLDAIFADLCREIESGELKRVVIDSLNDFERAIDDPAATKDYLSMFLAALARAGVTTLLTQKMGHVSGNNPIADIRYTSMVDTVIYLGNVEIESQIHRVISILKSRGSRAESDLCEILCDHKGLRVAEKFHGLSGILQGTAQGQYKQTVENIFQPLYFMRDFAVMGAGEDVDPEKRRKVLSDILNQIHTLDAALKDHFGFDPEETKGA